MLKETYLLSTVTSYLPMGLAKRHERHPGLHPKDHDQNGRLETPYSGPSRTFAFQKAMIN